MLDHAKKGLRSHLACATLMVAGALASCGTALAQDMKGPEGPVEITSGTGPGGTPDVVMRIAAKVLNETGIVENPIVVQNRTGGSWMVASNFVLGKPGDENVLMTIAGPVFSTPIKEGLPTVYDKLTPIALFVEGEIVVAVQADSPLNSLTDIVDKAKEKPNNVVVAGAQVGATDHQVVGQLEKIAGVDINFVPFESGAAAEAAFLGGNSDFVTLALNEAVPLIEGGKVKAVALLSKQRRSEDMFKDVATAQEQGFDIVQTQVWGLAGPPDLDPALARWWDDKLSKMVQTDEWKEQTERNLWRTDYVGYDKAKDYVQGMQDETYEILDTIGLVKK